jgi:CheY-like chemotaxis protein
MGTLKENTQRLMEFSKNINVLYVEDDEGVCAGLCGLLNKFFKSVTEAEDGAIGLELYKKSLDSDAMSYDLV